MDIRQGVDFRRRAVDAAASSVLPTETDTRTRLTREVEARIR